MDEFKTCEPVVNKFTKDLHSIEDHNFWIRRNGVCPYCRCGSRPVHKSVIVEKLKIKG